MGDGSDGMSGDGGEVFDDCESEVAGGRAGRMLIAVSGDSVTSCSSLVPGTCMNICGREGCGMVIVYCSVGDGFTDSVSNGAVFVTMVVLVLVKMLLVKIFWSYSL